MPLRVVPDTDWMTRGACRGQHQIMFPPLDLTPRQRAAAYARAVTICEGCPVLEACRNWALDTREAIATGIVGGMRPEELVEARKERVLERRANYVPRCGTETAYNRHLENNEHCDFCCDRHSRKVAYA